MVGSVTLGEKLQDWVVKVLETIYETDLCQLQHRVMGTIGSVLKYSAEIMF